MTCSIQNINVQLHCDTTVKKQKQVSGPYSTPQLRVELVKLVFGAHLEIVLIVFICSVTYYIFKILCGTFIL